MEYEIEATRVPRSMRCVCAWAGESVDYLGSLQICVFLVSLEASSCCSRKTRNDLHLCGCQC